MDKVTRGKTYVVTTYLLRINTYFALFNESIKQINTLYFKSIDNFGGNKFSTKQGVSALFFIDLD